MECRLGVSKLPERKITLYFNDTKWEHSDLYRFLDDLSKYFDHPITYDSDGRSPEQLFNDQHAIANNRMPFCSRILKAERLHKYYNDGDIIIFGIAPHEAEREDKINGVYLDIGNKRQAWANLHYPLIENDVSKKQVDDWMESTGIKEPFIYTLGFEHNNCSGGCVRAGKLQWKMLYEKLPEVYLDRERMEEEFMKRHNKRATIFKNESLKEFRIRIETGQLSKYYSRTIDFGEQLSFECVGICDFNN